MEVKQSGIHAVENDKRRGLIGRQGLQKIKIIVLGYYK